MSLRRLLHNKGRAGYGIATAAKVACLCCKNCMNAFTSYLVEPKVQEFLDVIGLSPDEIEV